MFTCEYMYVYNTKSFKAWALARKQTYVSLHNMSSYTKVSEIWYVYTCEYMYVYKKVLSVSARKGTDRCELHNLGSYTRVFLIQRMYTCKYNIIQEYLRYNACILWIYVYKQEVLSVSTRKGTSSYTVFGWQMAQAQTTSFFYIYIFFFLYGIFRYSCNNITRMMWEYIYIYV